MVRITPLGGEWYLPDGGRGEVCVMVFLWGWIVPCLRQGNWGQLESFWFQICDMEQDVLCCVWFFSATRLYTACHVISRGLDRYVCLCLLWWCPPSPLLLWGLLQSSVVVYITVQTVTWGLICKSGSHFTHSTHTQSLLNRGIIHGRWNVCVGERRVNVCTCSLTSETLWRKRALLAQRTQRFFLGRNTVWVKMQSVVFINCHLKCYFYKSTSCMSS